MRSSMLLVIALVFGLMAAASAYAMPGNPAPYPPGGGHLAAMPGNPAPYPPGGGHLA